MTDLTVNLRQGPYEDVFGSRPSDKGKSFASTTSRQTRNGKLGDGIAPIGPAGIRELYQKGSRVIRPEQRQYWINRAFLKGEQWIYFDRIRDRVNELPRDERVRTTVNKMWPSSRRLISKLTQRHLVFEVPPQTPDDAGILGSRVGKAVLEHACREQNWEALRLKQAWNGWLGGTGLVAVDWDGKAGTSLGIDPDTGKEFGTGEVSLQALSIAEVATEPGTRDIERARWWIKVSTLPPATVKDMFGLDRLPAADANMMLSPFQSKVLNSDSREVPLELTLVLNYYERPSKTNPKGYVATVVGEDIVEDGPWPFPWKDRLNVACLRETVVNDRWQGDTVFSAGVPVQTSYNASWSSIIEHLKLAGNARLGVTESSIDLIDEFTDTPGEVIPYADGTEAPAYISPPQMPQWWVQMPGELAQVLDDILGDNAVAKGQTPNNIESGLGLAILDEDDDTPVGMMAREIARCWSDIGTMVLKLYAAKVKETRVARASGVGAAPQVFRWTGKAFHGQTTAVVPTDAIIPRSPAAQEARALNFWDREIIPRDPKVFAKFAQVPGLDDMMSVFDPQLAKAQRENQDMSMGVPRIPDDFDDHKVHIDAVNAFRLSERYESSPADIRQLFDLHAQAHETLAAEAAAKQLSQQLVHPALGDAPSADGRGPVAMVPDQGSALGGDGAPAAPAAPDVPPAGPEPVGSAGPVMSPPTPEGA